MNLRFAFCTATSAIALQAFVEIALFSTPATAQITINSNGVVAGTITPPNRNPNFNQGTTRVDTDSQGRYFRNGVLVYQPSDPNLVQVDANGRYFVDFRGIPVVSTDGTLTSPVLSDGELQLINRFNHNTPVRFYGTIQDEFVVNGQYTGVATDPATGNRYQGTFTIRGQGPRYSDRNGGLSPTVFDFQSAYNFNANLPPRPTVSSYTFGSMPVDLTVTIPAGLNPITSPSSPTAPVSPVTPGQTPNGNLVDSRAFFEVTRVVLEGERRQSASVGPRSRVLLR